MQKKVLKNIRDDLYGGYEHIFELKYNPHEVNMNTNMMKKVPIALAALASSVVCADMDTRVTQLEAQMRQVRTQTARQTYGASTASARPLEEAQGIRFNFDIFYAHARPNGVEFNYVDGQATGSNANQPVLPLNGLVNDISFQWDWGFKVGVGYNFEHDGWDANAQYTYFDTSASTSSNPGSNSYTVPLVGWAALPEGVGGDEFFVYSDNATGLSDLEFDVVDLMLGRNYFMSKYLSMKPSFGLKATWIKFNKEARFTGGSSNENSPELGFNLGDATIYVKDRSNYWGMGPATGVDTNWYLGCGFSIYGNASGSLLFGRYQVWHRESSTITDRSDKTIDLDANVHAFVPVVDLNLGLAYGTYVANKEQYVEFSLGYECTYYWNATQCLDVDQTDVLFSVKRDPQDIGVQSIVARFTWEI